MAAERTTTSLSETISEHDRHGHSGLGLSAAELRGLPQDSVVGYAAGAFDLFHVGHLNILRQAKRHCDYLIAGVVSDEMLELTKGRAPVVPAAERAEIVSHVKFVDEVPEHLVRGYMVEPGSMVAHRLNQRVRADQIGMNKRPRIAQRIVIVRFRGEMHHRVRIADQRIHELSVRNISRDQFAALRIKTV